MIDPITKFNDENLEPMRGNLYKSHVFYSAGLFWRCKHGTTGFGKESKWVGCLRCAIKNPIAYFKFSFFGDGEIKI